MHPFLERYSRAYDAVAGSAARRVRDWRDILKELHADRGALLGSERYAEMGGVERARALRAVDEEINDAMDMMQNILHLRAEAIRVPRRFKHRARRIRRKANSAEDYMNLKVGDE